MLLVRQWAASAVFPEQADEIRTDLQRRDSAFELNCECLECLSSNSQDALAYSSFGTRSIFVSEYPITLMYLPKCHYSQSEGFGIKRARSKSRQRPAVARRLLKLKEAGN